MSEGNGIERAAPPARPNRRRQYVVNPSFQWKYAVTIGLMVFSLSSVLSSGLYMLLHQQARMRVMSPETYTGEVGLIIFLAAVVFSALTAGGVCVWSILMTHRVCGPLKLLQGYFSELGNGHLPTVRPLRKKDEFQELLGAFSTAIESLKDQKREELAAYEMVFDAAKAAAGNDDSLTMNTESVVHPLVGLHDAAIKALGGESPNDVTEPAARERHDTPVGVS